MTGLFPIVPPVTVATTAGYFDQSHMNRDIRRFANISPRELMVEQDATYVQDDGAVSSEY
jgi:AraC-like DNA-binding protein